MGGLGREGTLGGGGGEFGTGGQGNGGKGEGIDAWFAVEPEGAIMLHLNFGAFTFSSRCLLSKGAFLIFTALDF
jgi:hypothetical protein